MAATGNPSLPDPMNIKPFFDAILHPGRHGVHLWGLGIYKHWNPLVQRSIDRTDREFWAWAHKIQPL
jgi:hypothetical protein